MSALGQKQTLTAFLQMSALPPKAEIAEHHRHVRFVPKADQVQCSKKECYSIATSASPKRPNYFADPRDKVTPISIPTGNKIGVREV
jgi:hypothetical protein